MTAKPMMLSVKVVVRDHHGRCLVLRRSVASKNNPLKWDLPGGKLDPGETLDEAARREVLEETGLEVEIGGVLGRAESESPEMRIAYLVLEASANSSFVRLSDEHDEFRWVEPGKMAEVDLIGQFDAIARALATSATR